jgi:anti-anti-sigma factor
MMEHQGIELAFKKLQDDFPALRIGLAPKQGDPATRIALSGELLNDESPRFGTTLSGIVDSLDPGEKIIIDMSGLNYICSAGIGALTMALVASARKRISLVLVDPQASVYLVFKLLGFSSFFVFESTKGGIG